MALAIIRVYQYGRTWKRSLWEDGSGVMAQSLLLLLPPDISPLGFFM
jgi:hypothetical protein